MTILICTDLDRTLLPNGEVAEPAGARDQFDQLVGRPGVLLAYVSGRDPALVRVAMEQWDLPEPDFIAADVGTHVLEVDVDGEWIADEQWPEQLAERWQHVDTRRLDSLLLEGAGLTPQSAARQGAYKRSYSGISDAVVTPVLLCKLVGDMASRVCFAVSHDPDVDELLVDALPAGSGKRGAVEHLQSRLGVDDAHTIFIGDSGNDLDALLGPWPSVLVANGDVSTRRHVLAHPVEEDQPYLARAPYAAGIVEGVLDAFPELGPVDRDEPEVLDLCAN